MKLQKTLVTLALALAVAPSPSALAAGYDYPGHGTGPLGRGASFVAKADTPMALLYNPGGAARLQGTHVLLNGNLMSESISFTRRNYPNLGTGANVTLAPDRYRHDQTLTMPEVQNEDAPFITPFIAVTSDLGGVLRPYNLVLLAGFYGPHVHPTHTFPRYCKQGLNPCEPAARGDKDAVPAPNRYDLVNSDVFVIFPTLGLAWQPIKGLSIGAQFQATYAAFAFDLAVQGLPNATEDPQFDADINLDTTDAFTPTGIFGVHWAALPWLELGASVRIGFDLDFEGEVTAELPPNLSSSTELEPDPAPINLTVAQPWVVRAGARYINRDAEGRERFDVEADFVYETTSSVEKFDVQTEANLKIGSTRVNLGALTTAHHWQDTFSLRFGGAYHRHDLLGSGSALTLRAGMFYVSPAAPEAYSRLDFLPFTEVGLTAGLGVKWGRFRFDVAYAYIFHDEREIMPEGGDGRTGACAASGGAEGCGSKVTPIIPLEPPDPDKDISVGNGSYRFAIHVISLGAAVSFGE